MCGIAGILRFDDRPVDAQTLARLNESLAHRGRDGAAQMLGSRHGSSTNAPLSRRAEIGLAHRRLAIIDLSEAAAQPMSYADGKLWITYNGEIYNYVELREELIGHGYEFTTQSDTEVLLAAYRKWGADCVQRLDGMFAFAIWDEAEGRLFCARDPLGIKPFYYSAAPGQFAFASESVALAGLLGKGLDPDGVAAYLMCMYVPGPWSIFRGVRKLPQGHTLTVTPDGRSTLRRYWDLAGLGADKDTPEARRSLVDLMTAATRRQLRSDVPVGAFLSGGLDSSMVVALAAPQASEFHTFSVGFEGQVEDELPAARAIAERYGTRHHVLRLSAADAVRALEDALPRATEPIADPAMAPAYLLSKMAAGEGVKVLLNGTGGDEIFGGYNRYTARSAARRMLHAAPHRIRRLVAQLLPTRYAVLAGRLANPGFDMVAGTGGCPRLARAGFTTDADFANFLNRLVRECLPAPRDDVSPTHDRMLLDLKVYLADELLPLLDQMTMAWTIEGRVPLLDAELVRATYRLPAESHVSDGRTKILMRKIAEPYLGAEHVGRRKQGFGGPVAHWVDGSLPHILETLAGLRGSSDIPAAPVERLINKGFEGRLDRREAAEAFRLYCFAVWARRLDRS